MPAGIKIDPEKATCRKCRVKLTAYNSGDDYKEKRRFICKICNRAEIQRSARRRRYGIKPDDFDYLVKFQASKCAICRTPFIGNVNKAYIDHCHETGWVRGLLCNTCNIGLGAFKDNRHFLANAIRYLQHNHSPEKQPAKVLS